MHPLYFNPLDSTSNFIGTNPLSPVGIPVKTTVYPYFNPSIYQSFTFFSYPNALPSQTVSGTNQLGTSAGLTFSIPTSNITSSTTATTNFGGPITYFTVAYFSTLAWYSSQFSTFASFNASFYQLDPVSFSIRFGTELQTLYASTAGATEIIETYGYLYTIRDVIFSNVIYTIYHDEIYETLGVSVGTILYTTQYSSGLQTADTYNGGTRYPLAGSYAAGSSTFVNMLGSNVYSGLMDTTNSIIIYQNEQVSTYYSESLSYQVNISNLTAALNSVSGGSPDNEGSGLITVTTFSWVWETTAGGWTGSQVTDFSNYLFTISVNNYLHSTYGSIYTITSSSAAVTQVQSLITVQNNELSNAQTFMNNAVTTLQSQVSLAGQIIGSLASIMQSIIGNI